MDAIKQDLTAAQAEAVDHIDGPMLILAGPGSGKTRVVTSRIANLLHQGVPAWQIAALTFTNKAAEEMKSRVESMVPNQSVWMGTFHRFCAQTLRRYGGMVGLSENYSIYDMTDAKAAMKRAIAAAGVSTSHASPEQIASIISRHKNRLVTPEMMQGQMMSPKDTIAAKVYPVYQQQLLTANAVDFDDLLLHVAMLLRENPEIRQTLDAKFRYIMVDEYQDTNLAQYAIVRALSIDHANLAVTGDPDQSIYGWRGADINNILDFEKDYPDVRIVRLEQNYRSTPNILRVADHLIQYNTRRKAKSLLTDHPEGDPVVLRMYDDGYREADGIADEIADLLATQTLEPSDIAVFCRMNALTRSLEHAMRARSIPYQIVNGVEFYQRKEIKDLLAYLHLINNPNHDVALQRVINVPTRGIGNKTIERIRDFADANRLSMLEAARQAASIEGLAKRSATMVAKFVSLYDRLAIKATATLEDLIRYLIEEIEFEDYLEKTAVEGQDESKIANVDEFVTAAVEFDRMHPEDGSLELFLEQVALVADTDAMDEESNRVTLMTLHAAKGLEFPRVYVIGVEEDLLPHKRSKDTLAEIEEERRLLFVGITRAMNHLQLSLAKRRPIRGDFRPVIPSMFLNELPLDEMRRIEPETVNQWAHSDYGQSYPEFETESQDQSYPESWDLPSDDVDSSDGPADFVSEALNDSPYRVEVLPPRTGFSAEKTLSSEPAVVPRKPKRSKPKKSIQGIKTGADFLEAAGPSPMEYREGREVQHVEHGRGTIIQANGRGPKRTVRVRFEDAEHTYRIAFAKLELIGSDSSSSAE